MSGRVAGKVALITGAARGQGRSHALRLAEEGADIVLVDACIDYETLGYPMATEADLAETKQLVEKLGRKALAIRADVRDLRAMEQAAADTVAAFGRLDFVHANAGICPMTADQTVQHWIDVCNINLTGVLNTVNAALPHLKSGASILVTGSVAALMSSGPSEDPGGIGYTFAKRSLIPLVQDLAKVLAPQQIRINGVHPTNVDTHMLQNIDMYRAFRPDLENPTREDAELSFPAQQSMPVPYVESKDISEVVLLLASDASRYITGQFIGVDAGAMLKL